MKFNLGKSLKDGFNATSKWAKVHSHEIYAGLGIGCFFGAIATTGLAVIKASEIKKQKEIENVSNTNKEPYPLTIQQVFPFVWKEFVIPVGFAFTGTGFIILSVKKSNRHYAALSTSYELLRSAAENYKENVIEVIGKNKEAKVRANIAQKDIDNDPPVDEKIIINTTGNTLFKESLTGQYFRGNLNVVKNKCNELTHRLNTNATGYVGVNEWLTDLGVEESSMFEESGWSVCDQGTAVVVNTDSAVICKATGEPCIVIQYSMYPIDDYYNYQK